MRKLENGDRVYVRIKVPALVVGADPRCPGNVIVRGVDGIPVHVDGDGNPLHMATYTEDAIEVASDD